MTLVYKNKIYSDGAQNSSLYLPDTQNLNLYFNGNYNSGFYYSGTIICILLKLINLKFKFIF